MVFAFFKNDKNKKSQYETERALVLSGSVKDRKKIASSPTTHPEILYYMAEHDKDATVRRAVVDNTATPVHAAPILSKDNDVDVRLALVARLVTLLPDLSQDKQSQLYHYAVEALGNLALDNVLKVRVALSSALKDVADAPPTVVGTLARDIEREVAEPILRFCIALPDADLLDILKSHPEPWVVQAIASRPKVSPPMSQAVVDKQDEPAGKTLLNNDGADISLATLRDIVALAQKFPSWQKPVAMKKNLTAAMAKSLLEFVDSSVRHLLMERTDFTPDEQKELVDSVNRRIQLTIKGDGQGGYRVKELHAQKQLTPDLLNDALSMREVGFVTESIATLLGVHPSALEKLMATRAPKPIVALCWKAGLPMRFALRVQQEIAKIPHTELIYPRGGTDYPMTDVELKKQLEFLGL